MRRRTLLSLQDSKFGQQYTQLAASVLALQALGHEAPLIVQAIADLKAYMKTLDEEARMWVKDNLPIREKALEMRLKDVSYLLYALHKARQTGKVLLLAQAYLHVLEQLKYGLWPQSNLEEILLASRNNPLYLEVFKILVDNPKVSAQFQQQLDLGVVEKKPTSSLDEEILAQCTCPITLEIMHEPVTIESGHTFEKRAILDWFQRSNRNPVTNEPVKDTSETALHTNLTVKNLIMKYHLLEPAISAHGEINAPGETKEMADVSVNHLTI